ncbi:MAG: hypothetical protein HYT16_01680 [DPANN group archaeon]|nr:hypothetical protein [DPANN group archaeon]
MDHKHKLYFGIGVIILILIIGIIFVNFGPRASVKQAYSVPGPEEVVRQYFESWGNKNWPDMYATISDGFKRIDENAKDLASFRNFASAQGITGVNIITIKEKSNDGRTATVAYSVNFILSDGSKRQFSDSFTLKFRDGDIIRGWKLIHPYGKNIDAS